MRGIENPERRRDLVLRLKRVEGQLRGIQAMVEKAEDCERVAQQMTAARKALDRAFYVMVACAIEQAGASPDDGPREVERRLGEVSALIERFA